jgi:peptide/nickel transport system substrate-binding protein
MKMYQFRALYLFVLLSIVVATCYYCQPPDAGKEGALNIRIEAGVPLLNPLLPSPGYARYVSARIFQTLGELDPQTLVMQPLLAKQIPTERAVTDGPMKGTLAYDFEINEAATWDNGTPVTAADVAFTLKLIFNPVMPTQTFRGYYEYLKGFETYPDNPRKCTFYLDHYYILGVESLCQTPVYPAYNYDPKGLLANVSVADLLDPANVTALVAAEGNPLKALADEFTQPKYANDKNFISGSGPYRLEALDAAQGVTLVKKDTYWGDKAGNENPLVKAYPKKITYKVVENEDAAINLLKSGDLDLAMGIAPPRFAELQNDPILKEKYNFSTSWSPQYNRWMLNLRDPRLADKRVRQALAHLVDYDFLIQTVQNKIADRTLGVINPVKPYYAKDVPLYTLNIQKAKDLLAAAGWTDTDNDGFADKMVNGTRAKLTIKVMVPPVKIAEQTIENLKSTAARAGVEIVADVRDLNVITPATRKGDFESTIIGAALFPGLEDYYQQFHSKSLAPAGDNRSGFANPQADQLIDAIRTTRDVEQRKALYIQMQTLLYDEVPEIPLYAPRNRYIVAKKIAKPVLSPNRPGYYEHLFE